MIAEDSDYTRQGTASDCYLTHVPNHSTPCKDKSPYEIARLAGWIGDEWLFLAGYRHSPGGENRPKAAVRATLIPRKFIIEFMRAL